MFIMYDDVNLDLIPNGPHAVASYINGRFANHDEAKRRFPHARHLGISVAGNVPADAYDVEQGDYSPDDVPDLYRTAVEHGIWRPCFYANLSTMPEVKKALNTVVNARHDIRLWVAVWDQTPSLVPGYDAKQFTDRALGRSLDESVCESDFFKPLGKPTPAPAPKPPTEHLPQARVTFDPDDHTWKIEGIAATTEVERPGQ